MRETERVYRLSRHRPAVGREVNQRGHFVDVRQGRIGNKAEDLTSARAFGSSNDLVLLRTCV